MADNISSIAECSEEYLVLLSVDFRQYLLVDV
nr:MAG TPA: hypothetical protein [Caudoviricetes sp.]